MQWYPGWDSLTAVSRWHSFFEIAGIACLALLVGAEILAFQYGHRKDLLVGIAEEKRQKDDDDAEARRKTEVDALQNRLIEADKKVAELDRLRQPRHLTDSQKAKLTKFITGNSRGSAGFTIKANVAESDARAYADEIAAFFNAPPINWQVKVDNSMIAGADISGLWITIKDTAAIPAATGLLQAGFVDAGFPIKKDVQVDPGVPSRDDIWLTVGTKK